MAKTLTEAALTTRNARASLPAGVHWRGLDPEVHLGYRRGKRGGRWLVRWRAGVGYAQTTIGTADDVVSEGTLSFEAASKLAKQTVEAQRRAAVAAAAGPAVTVRLAVEAYVARRNARASARAGRPIRSDAGSRLTLHVLSDAKLPDIALHALAEDVLVQWRVGLSGKASNQSAQRED